MTSRDGKITTAAHARLPSSFAGMRLITFSLALLVTLDAPAAAQSDQSIVDVKIVGDAIPVSLTGIPGDVARGRQIVANRQVGLCLLCHAGPVVEERFQGNLAPDLAGTGSRWSEGQLRLRIVDARHVNPATIMPSYYRIESLTQVGKQWQGKPILAAQQIEDVVAYLLTLRNDDAGPNVKQGTSQ